MIMLYETLPQQDRRTAEKRAKRLLRTTPAAPRPVPYPIEINDSPTMLTRAQSAAEQFCIALNVAGMHMPAMIAELIAPMETPKHRLRQLQTFWELITERKIWPLQILGDYARCVGYRLQDAQKGCCGARL